ncbi:hypothetical protein ACP70R_021897 [Stipagrostis hirtigluma subsp. patula]
MGKHAEMDEGGRKRDREGERETGGPTRKKGDPVAESRRREEEEIERYMAKYPGEDWSDRLAVQARQYFEDWQAVWACVFGSFEATTPIPPMRFTDEPVPSHAEDQDTVQIFSVKIKEILRGLQWPLDVFGVIAVRDSIDRSRNIIFNRQRDNCQTLTEEDPYLLLTGPTRAVVVSDPVYFEVVLRVKGSVESEDKELSLLTVPLTDYSEIVRTCLINEEYTSKLSTLELTFGYIVSSVEATISVHVTEGSWPDGFYGKFSACTPSLRQNEILLLDPGCEKVPVNGNGMIKLSCCVASVELEGELEVSVAAFQYDSDENKIKFVKNDTEGFRPKKAGKSFGKLDVGFCKMDITVAWSLMSLVPAHYA